MTLFFASGRPEHVGKRTVQRATLTLHNHAFWCRLRRPLPALAGALLGLFATANQAAEAPPPLRIAQAQDVLVQGMKNALKECNLEGVKVFTSEGIGPDFPIAQARAPGPGGYQTKFPVSVFEQAVLNVRKMEWIRPIPHPVADQYFKGDDGYYWNKSYWSKIGPCLDIVEFLLTQNPKVDGTSQGSINSRPIQHAIRIQMVKLIAPLAEAGADPFTPDARTGNTGLMDMGVPAEFDVDACAKKNPDYCTPGIIAHRTWNWLINHATPADINHQNARGETGLIKEVKRGGYEDDLIRRAKVWLEAGADPCIKDQQGRTAADYALAGNAFTLRTVIACTS